MAEQHPMVCAARCSAVSLVSACLLTGCMNFTPAYQRPVAPVAASYPLDLPAGALSGSTTGSTTGSTAAADIDWRQFFADARLRRLIEVALANNRDLRVAVLNIDKARAALRIQRADELPTVGVGLSAQREPGSSGGLVNTYAAGFQMSSYELDLFGRVRSLTEAARAEWLSSEASRQTVQIALIAAVANGYLNLLADRELLAVTRDTLTTRQDSYRLTRLQFEHGAASEIDFRQAEQLLEGARATLAQTERQQALDEDALVLLLGQPMPADLPAGLPLEQQPGVGALPAGLPSDLLVRRPDVRAAEEQLLAANANIGAARAAFFPRISLTASEGTASNALSGLFASGSFAFTGTATLLQPLFNAGRNQATLDQARVNRDIAVAQYEKSIQTAFREVADALAGRATLSEQLRAQTAQARAAEITFKLADLRYRNGASSYLDVLDAQRASFAAQQATVQVQLQQVQNLVTLYQVLGGGWKAASGPQ
jgi:multidrug efflux system outer membrane protein